MEPQSEAEKSRYRKKLLKKKKKKEKGQDKLDKCPGFS